MHKSIMGDLTCMIHNALYVTDLFVSNDDNHLNLSLHATDLVHQNPGERKQVVCDI